MSSMRRALPACADRLVTATSRRSLAVLSAAALFALGSFTFSGCSSSEKSDIVVAEVGPRTITLDYFERKMNTMGEQFLPEDIETREGREKLLEVMIDKEVMALKAEELGMASDGEADKQAEQIAMLRAVSLMREEASAAGKNPTEDDLLDYYEKLPRKLTVSYMLFDHRGEALEAKGLVEGGELWREVADRMEAGDPGPSKDYTLFMRYGTVADEMEAKIFDLPVGQVSDPIDSIYGWFLVRVEDITMERVQPFDTMADKVRESVIEQQSTLLLMAFLEQVLEDYEFTLDDEVLQVVFDALPEDVPLSPPPAKEDLQPLNVKPVDLDRVLMSYHDQVWTVRRFADFYDATSPFARPRRERRLGSLRRFVKEQAVRDLMPVAARDRGYLEHPEVLDEMKLRREQAMVTRLHRELIASEVEVSPEEVEQYWAEHSEEFSRPEQRNVSVVIAASESDAVSAQIDVQSGMKWEEVVEKYCIESDIKQRKGVVGGVTRDTSSPLTEHAFALDNVGDFTAPTEIGPDQWLLMRLEGITPAEQPELADVREQVGRTVQSMKEETLFRDKVSEWRASYTVKTHPDELMKAVYDPAPQTQSIPVRMGGPM